MNNLEASDLFKTHSNVSGASEDTFYKIGDIGLIPIMVCCITVPYFTTHTASFRRFSQNRQRNHKIKATAPK